MTGRQRKGRSAWGFRPRPSLSHDQHVRPAFDPGNKTCSSISLCLRRAGCRHADHERLSRFMPSMQTVVSSPTRTVYIGPDHPFVIIGERINPTGRKKLAAE